MVIGRAVILKQYGEPFVIEEMKVPDPEPGAIMLKMTQAGVCGSDLHAWRGHASALMSLPETGRVMGHEGSGVVHALGAGVTTDSLGAPIAEGDRILNSAVQPCYQCHHCQRGEYNWCPTYPSNRDWGAFPYFVGTYADYYYLPPNQPVYKVPDELPDSMLSFVNCAMGTVTEGLMRAQAGPGQTVVIQGAGGLGLNATAVARHFGVQQIIILDRLENRLALARDFGADETINIDEYDTVAARKDRVFELTGGRGADIVMELVGNASLMEEGIPMLSSGGTFVQIGAVQGGATAAISPAMLLRGKRIIGSLMYRPHILPILLGILTKYRESMPFDRIVSTEYALVDVNAAFDDAEWQGGGTEVTRAILRP